MSNRKYYTGMSQDYKNRFIQHQNGQCKTTSKHLPVHLIKYFTCENRTEARKLEVKIKKRGAKRFMNDLIYKEFPFCDAMIKPKKQVNSPGTHK